MTKTFRMMDLDCANCAAKMEAAIQKIDGVEKVSISFMQQKMTVTADEDCMDTVMKQAVKICRKIEPDCRILL